MIKSSDLKTTHAIGSVLESIGSTPLVQLSRISNIVGVSAYAKLELANPGGSIKDRTALSIVQKGLVEGMITDQTTIIESSSGNMAIGLAQVCCYYNIPLIIVVDPKANPHTIKILSAYGVKIEKVTKPLKEGGFLGARLKRVKEIQDNNTNIFWSNQYNNNANPTAHHKTMAEIVDANIGQIDYIFVATSTCGTLMGCAEYIETNNLSTKLIAVDAVGSVVFNQEPKKRLIPGHGAGVPSNFLRREVVEKVVHVDDLECVKGCHLLLKNEGILAGGSSGAAISAFMKLAPELPVDSKAVLILCDRGERYMETIYNRDWVKEHFGSVDL